MGAKTLLKLDWDAFAGIIAATLALVLHLLHVISIDVLITISVVLIAFLFIGNLRREHVTDQMQAELHSVAAAVFSLQSALKPNDTVLVGPASITSESRHFSKHARGEMVWFPRVPSKFRPQELFDILMWPAIANPNRRLDPVHPRPAAEGSPATGSPS